MDLYSSKSSSFPQKLIILLFEFVLLVCSYWVLFGKGGILIMKAVGADFSFGDLERNLVLFSLMLLVFVRLKLTLFYLIKRSIPWAEAFSIPFAFGLYYLGFSLLGFHKQIPLDVLDGLAIGLFLFGSFINSYSEIWRDRWKKRTENIGKLYTKGLFKYAMHINYFGDILWVIALALLTRNIYAVAIPIFLVCFFVFYNIPLLDRYLSEKYKAAFTDYALSTKKLIPFIY